MDVRYNAMEDVMEGTYGYLDRTEDARDTRLEAMALGNNYESDIFVMKSLS
jgi:hypothetical protein